MKAAAINEQVIDVGGWAPRGKTPTTTSKFGRGPRWHILPAYTVNGIILSRIYQGSMAELFDEFIAELLQFCGRFPEPNSVIVMDNAAKCVRTPVYDLFTRLPTLLPLIQSRNSFLC